MVLDDGTTMVDIEIPSHSAMIDFESNVISGVTDTAVGDVNIAVITKQAIVAALQGGDPGTPVCGRQLPSMELDGAGNWATDYDLDSPYSTGSGCDKLHDFGPGDWVQVAANDLIDFSPATGDLQTVARVIDFLDDDGHVFEVPAITWLATEGITKGCNPPLNFNFCPDDNVTRAQMAGFLRRALG